MPESGREQLAGTFLAFFYGEQCVTDTLSPMVHAAPDEENRLFLSTQLVDEARHSYFFARFFSEVLGIGAGLQSALAEAGAQVRELTGDDGDYNRIFRPRTGELATVTEAVRA